MKERILKKALFGYDKSDVCKYIAELNSEFSDRILDLTDRHNQQEGELKARITSLENELEVCHQSKDEIATAILDATEYANLLRKNADAHSADLNEKLERSFNEQYARVEDYRRTIDDIRALLAQFLASTDGALANFRDSLDAATEEHLPQRDDEPETEPAE